VIGALVFLAMATAGLLLFDKNQQSSKPEKVGRLIVGDQPKKEELTFYKTLTERGDKRPPAADLKPAKALPSPKVDKRRPAQTPVQEATHPTLKLYTLQVGSFVEKESAQKVVRKLTAKGYPAYLVKVMVSDGEMRYRVRVGSFADKMKAKPVAERLEKEEALKSFITFLEKGSQ
jgi:cell division protein FtsN